MTPTDSELIRRSATDPGQFAEIFERHFTPIYRYLYRRVGAPLADDLASQTFTEAFAKRERYDAGWPVALPWLYGIASNLLRRHHRREKRQLRAYARLGIDPLSSDELSPLLDRLDAEVSGPKLADALSRLSGKDRDVLLLLAWADLSYRDIGFALDIPVGTVRSRLNRARRKMREQLGLDKASGGLDTRFLKEAEVVDGRA
jgi:RNA polymerase sigma factor (sigma-70 family)